MHVLIYVRVSTDKQADKELSLPAQLAACRQYAAQRNWHVLEEFIEPGASARTADRPELKRLLSRCRDSNPPVGAVIVHKLDRLARSVADHVAIRTLLAKHKVRLVSVSENLDDSTSGQLVEHIMAAIAEFYSANLGDEVRKGMKQKVLQGGWPHKPPLGYITKKDVFGRSRVELDPLLAPLVRQAFELASLGTEPPSTLRFTLARLGLTRKNGGLLHKSGVSIILRNPFYCGRVSWKGETFQGTHPPIVSPEEFDKVQASLGQRHHETRGRSSLLAGLAQCSSCGAFVSAESHGRHTYYRCRNNMQGRQRCRAPFCNVQNTHEGLKAIYSQIPVTPELRKALSDRLKMLRRAEDEARHQSETAMQARLDSLKARAVRLASALANGTMEPDVYRLAAQPLQDEQEMLKHRLGHRRRRRHHLPAAANAWQMHKAFRVPQQCELARLLFDEVTLSRDGIASHRLTALAVEPEAA